ncbi:CehA/McbA family metallohydrolase [Streptomyces sp. NBC_01264]|uniref:CehA/McbA family metallohydrolase n=1 Tax=Streptomyces sp. NBC_01264 TaxID=2903804 RepID=UPI0022501725|nr:CehA/McbA family metallohydrolase [Streptomyces sp. NBC_01264]MCX4781629.1 CehA/McbA family metallohydrolase [Streptomyces sp. NBC_01264]
MRLGALMAAGGLAALVPVDTARAQTSAGAAEPGPGARVTTAYPGHSPFGFDQWSSVDFVVPAGVNRISVTRTFDHYDGLPGIMSDVLDIGLFGPSGFRGWSGGARDAFTVSGADATPGYVPGPVEPGRWSVALGPVVFNPAGMNWRVEVTLEYGPPLSSTPFAVLPTSAPSRGQIPGFPVPLPFWYRGDMHTHTVHSDGGRTLGELVGAARDNGLHFLGSTDHNTSAAGVSWAGSIPSDLLVINGEEVTTRHGHWLALGMPQGEVMDWHFGPGNTGVMAQHANYLRDRGGLVVAAHPLTPAPGSFWEFGFGDVDAIEVWNGPWTLDDEAAVAMWAAMLFFGQRVPAVANSDTHAPSDVVGLPQTVVRSTALSRDAILDGVRRGHSYLAESSKVSVSLSASCNGRHAGPGDSLPVSFFDAVDVSVSVYGAPNSFLTLYTEWGLMLATWIGGDGVGHLNWRGWGLGSVFARVEVRRPKPGSSTLDQMVALSNPVWFGPAPTPKPVYQGGQTFLSTVRYPNSWSAVAPMPGIGGAPTFNGPRASITGLSTGSALTVGLSGDNGLWINERQTNGQWQSWQQLAGPGAQGRPILDLGEAAEAAFRRALRAARGASAPAARIVSSGATAGITAAGPAGAAAGIVQAGAAFRDAAIAGMPDGSAQIVAVSLDGTLYHQVRQVGGRMTGFTPVPGAAGGKTWTAVKVAIAAMPDGSVQVLSYGSSGNMYLNIRKPNGSWGTWNPVPGARGAATFAGPALDIAGLPDGSSQLLAIGMDGMVYHQVRHPDGHFDGFATPRGVTTPTMSASAIAIAGMPDGTAQVLAVGADGNVWHDIRFPASWQGFRPLSGPQGADRLRGGQLSIAGMRDGTSQVLVIAPS